MPSLRASTYRPSKPKSAKVDGVVAVRPERHRNVPRWQHQQPLDGKDGNRDEDYHDRRGFGEKCHPTARCKNDWRGRVSQAAVARKVPPVHGRATTRTGGDGSLRQRKLLVASVKVV